MHFATLSFAYFFLVVLTGWWALVSFPSARKVWLLAASYFFYGSLSVPLVGILASSSALNWALGQLMAGARAPSRRRQLMWLGVALNLGLLGTFKYYGFLQQTSQDIARAMGLSSPLPAIELAVPAGISFFTFQSLAYLIDLSRGRIRPAKSALDFLLFTAFFPKLLSGPICRGGDLLVQIGGPTPKRIAPLSQAVGLIAAGLFKKAILSTLLGVRLVDDAFLAPENFSGLSLMVAAYAYSIQLYCDFSGYTDMARGLALLFGFRLPDNFNSPYAATDPGTFWRCWHMTFSVWLRDYVYFPLGGSKESAGRTYFNLVATFTLCGLWHGASWGFVLWGALHGVVLCLHKIVRDTRRALGWLGTEPVWYRVAGWLLTFNIVVFSRILFRAGDLQTAGSYFSRILTWTSGPHRFDRWVILAALIGLALNFVGRSVRRRFLELHEAIPTRLAPLLWAGIGVALLALLPGDVAPYIYFQF